MKSRQPTNKEITISIIEASVEHRLSAAVHMYSHTSPHIRVTSTADGPQAVHKVALSNVKGFPPHL